MAATGVAAAGKAILEDTVYMTVLKVFSYTWLTTLPSTHVTRSIEAVLYIVLTLFRAPISISKAPSEINGDHIQAPALRKGQIWSGRVTGGNLPRARARLASARQTGRHHHR